MNWGDLKLSKKRLRKGLYFHRPHDIYYYVYFVLNLEPVFNYILYYDTLRAEHLEICLWAASNTLKRSNQVRGFT